MTNYAVSKQFGHFVQVWRIEAESKNDAWERAEVDGRLQYQTVYIEINHSSNYVTDIDENSKTNTISQDQYDRWLNEAMELGMKIDDYCGLPFNNVPNNVTNK